MPPSTKLSGFEDQDMIDYTRTSFTAYVEWAVEANSMAPDCPWRTAWTLFELAVLRSSRTANTRDAGSDNQNVDASTKDEGSPSKSGS